LTQALIRSGLCSTYSLLLVAAGALIGSLALLNFAEARGAEAPAPTATEPDSGERDGAFRLVLGNRYLLAVAIVILIANWVKTNSDSLLFAVVQEVLGSEAASRGITATAALDAFTADQTTAFYGDFFFWVNVVALGMQSLLASRLLKHGGFGALFLALPAISLVAYPVLAAAPILLLFRLAKIAEDSTTYSLHNTATQVLWLPTTREMKYRGKAAIDTFFVRLGDALAALTTFVGIQWLILPARDFFVLNACLALAWLVVAVIAVYEHRALTEPADGLADAAVEARSAGLS
jgi:AAA family ATP:ADP antiporter